MRLQIKLGTAILATVLLGASALPVAAQKSADTLRITFRDAVPIARGWQLRARGVCGRRSAATRSRKYPS